MLKQISINFSIELPSSYPIWIGTQLLEKVTQWMPEKKYSTIIIITDQNVKKLYAKLIAKYLQETGYKTLNLSFPAGEKSKNIQTKCQIEQQMFAHSCDRNSLILALGGGVVGDLAGFIAATYMRGIDYIQIPTTLLAMVDSSTGGKTSINTSYGKNLIGAFWQPKAVISDIRCLHSLPKKQIINGLIEAIKMFLTHDKTSLEILNKNIQQIPREAKNDAESHNKILSFTEENMIDLIQRANNIKKEIVKDDEKETKQRVSLNFGHTIGHALEKITNYKILHGFAVALGLLVEAKIAQIIGLLSKEDYLFIQELLNHLNIYKNDLKIFNIQQIIQLTKLDKKTKNGEAHYVLLQKLGKVYSLNECFAHPIADEIVKQAFFAIIKN